MAKPSWFKIRNANNAASITILGDIGAWGVSFADFKRSVDAAGKPKELHISINSDGGDVYTGFAIYNYLQRHAARKIVTIEGLAASMASVVAMIGDEIVMPANATIMIHNPVGQIAGEGEQIVQFGESVKKMRMQIANAYADRTLMDVKDILKMMNSQTWLGAEEALAKGFATRIEEPVKIAAYFDLSKYRNAPKSYGQNKGKRPMAKNQQRAAADDFEGEEIDRDAIRKEERDALLARGKEIGALCKIAGKPQLAAQFIEDDKTPAEVTAELAKLADEDAKKRGGKKGTEVSARHAAGNDDSAVPEINTEKVYENWNKRKALGL